MPSRRLAVLDAVVAALGGAGKPASLTIQRSRYHPVDLAVGAAVSQVFLVREPVETGDTNQVDRLLTIRIATQVKINPATGDSTDVALDPYLVWNVQALLQAATLNAGAGAIASQVDEAGTEWGDDDGLDDYVGVAVQNFEIEYQTAYDDPETIG